MDLAKTSLLSLLATITKLLAALVVNKAVAIFVGPSGLAIIGQFQNFIQLSMTAAQGGISTGVTKYTAEYGAENDRLPIFLSTALKVSLVCSVVVALATVTFSSYLSDYFLKSSDYGYVFVVFGCTIFFFVLNSFLLSILNGLKKIKLFIGINVAQSVYSLVFTSALIYFFGLDGALLGIATNQSVVFIYAVFLLKKKNIMPISLFGHGFDQEEGRKLFKYSIMAFTSAATVPVSHLYIRNHLGDSLSWDAAGYWQAIWYVSSMYLMVVTTALSTYYLPRLSEITDKTELRRELLYGYKIFIPIVLVLSLVIFLLKDLIVWLLFDESFYPMLVLFKWQLIGSVFKMAVWLLAHIMLAKTMMKEYISTEIFFSLSFVILSLVCITKYGLVGVTYAYAINYSMYFFVMLFITKKQLY